MAQFKKKLNLAMSKDVMRQDLCRMYFSDGFLYVTEAHLLIRQSLSLHGFDAIDIQNLNGKYITREQYEAILKGFLHEVNETEIIAETKTGKIVIDLHTHDNKFVKTMKTVIKNIQNDNGEVTRNIGFDIRFFEIIRKCFFLEADNAIRVTIKSDHRGVIISAPNYKYPASEQLAVLMPVTIPAQYRD